jgi:hypothetical protein
MITHGRRSESELLVVFLKIRAFACRYTTPPLTTTRTQHLHHSRPHTCQELLAQEVLQHRRCCRDDRSLGICCRGGAAQRRCCRDDRSLGICCRGGAAGTTEVQGTRVWGPSVVPSGAGQRFCGTCRPPPGATEGQGPVVPRPSVVLGPSDLAGGPPGVWLGLWGLSG